MMKDIDVEKLLNKVSMGCSEKDKKIIKEFILSLNQKELERPT